MDAFEQLVQERQRTMFVFYGFETADGSPGANYFKQAYSLSEALADLCANEGVVGEHYLVTDAFVEASDDDVILHVELRAP